MLTYGQVKDWRPGPLDSAGEGLRRSIRRLESARDEVEQTAVPDSWEGLSRIAAEARKAALVVSMGSRIDTGRSLIRAFFTAETSVTALRRSIDDVEGEAGTKEFRIGTDGSVTDVAEPPEFATPRAADGWSASRQGIADGLADEVGRIVDRAVEIDSALVAAIPARSDDQELRGLADPGVAQRWGELSGAERQAVLTEIVEEELDDLDLDPPPDVTFLDPDDPDDRADPDFDPDFHENGLNGRYSNGRNEIWIHPGTLDDPGRLGTAAHEARHTRQFDAIDDLGQNPWQWLTGDDPFEQHEESGITRDQAESWRENFEGGNYIQAGVIGPDGVEYDFDDYAQQPVEEDAFDHGGDYLDDLTPEELERLLEESR